MIVPCFFWTCFLVHLLRSWPRSRGPCRRNAQHRSPRTWWARSRPKGRRLWPKGKPEENSRKTIEKWILTLRIHQTWLAGKWTTYIFHSISIDQWFFLFKPPFLRFFSLPCLITRRYHNEHLALQIWFFIAINTRLAILERNPKCPIAARNDKPSPLSLS